MKKEEIDDRLMDALLRGKNEHALEIKLEEQTESRSKRGRYVAGMLAAAAALMLGASFVLSRAEDQKEPYSELANSTEYRRNKSAELYAKSQIRSHSKKAKIEDPPPLDTLVSATIPPVIEPTLDIEHVAGIETLGEKPLVVEASIASLDEQPSGEVATLTPNTFSPNATTPAGSRASTRLSPAKPKAERRRQFSPLASVNAVPFGFRQSESFRGRTEKYGELVDQPWKEPNNDALSTFSVDVNTASFTNLRRFLKDGRTIPKDAVRIEELVNYFDYSYPQPEGKDPFKVDLAMAVCPWESKHHLVRVALQGRDIPQENRGDANLVFLIDVSGSMHDSDKLPLLASSLGLMVEELREDDSVAIVVYAGSEGVVLEPTKMGQGGREKVINSLEKLRAGGSTNGGAGIKLAYRLAKEQFIENGINRVILATDGDFNVGVTGNESLVSLVKQEAKAGVFLSVCGFGRGNLNDSMLEAITNNGNGVYYYIDSIEEAHRVFLDKLTGTLVAIAKDVKIQVEFNPSKVAHYRLIGYANRILQKEDFNNDKVDAGDIGSGHQVTAFYEIVPKGVTDTVRPLVDDLKYQNQTEAEAPSINPSADWLTVKLRHKKPTEDTSRLQEFILRGDASPWQQTDDDFRFAAGIALWGMGLRQIDDLDNQLDKARMIISESTKNNENREAFSKILSLGSKN